MPMDLASALGILVVCSGLLSHAVTTMRTTAIQTSAFIVNAETLQELALRHSGQRSLLGYCDFPP